MLADFVIRRRRVVLWGMSLLVIGLMAFVPQNELNDEFVKYFDERVDFRVDTDFTTENLTGIYNIAYSLEAGESGAISEPAFLNKLDAPVLLIDPQGAVIHANDEALHLLDKSPDQVAGFRGGDFTEATRRLQLLKAHPGSVRSRSASRGDHPC